MLQPLPGATVTSPDLDNVANAISTATEPDEASDAVIDDLVTELRGLHRKAALEFALTVGRLTIDRLFGGSLEKWRAGGAKSGSFRKLAAKLDPLDIPGLSSGSLSRAVSLVDLDARVGIAGRPQLLAAHAIAVLGLEPAQQERLLGEAEANDWSPTDLKAAAEKVKKESAPATGRTGRMGRPRLPAFVKTVNRWERELADEGAFAELDQVAELDPAEAERLVNVVEEMRMRCEIVLRGLREAPS